MKILTIEPVEKFAKDFINVVPASEFIPEWYRKSDSKVKGFDMEALPAPPFSLTSTYKKCSPFFDALSIGYIAYLTADIEVTKKPDGMPYVVFRTNRTIVTEHSNEQWEGLPCPEGYSYYVYKWHNQHVLKTPKDYSMLFTNPFNRFDLPFQTITGIVDTDKYNLTVHFPFFIKNSFTGIIKSGTPICQMIPIKRDAWKREILEYEDGKYEINHEKYRSVIKRAYKNLFWQRKEYR